MKTDILVVGAGFAGAVIAERLASQLNRKILIIDKRNHIGGNCYDCYDKSGVLIHKYGAHLFHTDKKVVFDYLSEFTKWHKYEHKVKACLKDVIYDMPINLNTINKFFGRDFGQKECKDYLNTIKVKIKNPKNAEEQVISQVGWEIYDNFFKNYTIKQWERHPRKLDALVTARVPVRLNTDDRYFSDPYQFMPKKGFTDLFKKILKHKNIDIKLKTDFGKIKEKIDYNVLIYTGCIDDFFNNKFGALPYRSLKFKFKNYDQPFYQDYTVINFPNEHKYTKAVEIKHATQQKISKTTVGYEYPSRTGEQYYPVFEPKNEKLYQKYAIEAKKLKNTYFIGRLAEYKYYDMDDVIFSSLSLFNKLKNKI